MFRLCTYALVALVVVLAASASAVAFTDLFVFGDSLSDVGNIAEAPIINTPGPYYYNGRFSNGPVYAELVAEALGLGPLTHSLDGGHDYAYGGAMTTGTGFPENIFVRDVDDQLNTFLGGPPADPEALFVVFAGANDLIDDPGDTSSPVNSLIGSITALINDGAREFLVMNLPLLGLTPRFNLSPTAMNDSTMAFNAGLATALDTLQANHSDVTLRQLDVAEVFSQVVATPAAFGLVNATEPAAPSLSPGDTSYNTSLIVSDPDSYLFWDKLHPTATGHALLAEQVLRTLRAGDYNDDGVVDGADYTVWRDLLGQTVALPNETATLGSVTQEDYDAWTANFGTSLVTGGTGALVSVPEPSGLVLMVLSLVAAVAIRRLDLVERAERPSRALHARHPAGL